MEIKENTTVKATITFIDFVALLAFYFKYSPNKELPLTGLQKEKKEGAWGINMSRNKWEEIITFYFKANGIHVTSITLHKDQWTIEGIKGDNVPILQKNLVFLLNKHANKLTSKTLLTISAFTKMNDLLTVEDLIDHADFKSGNLGLPGVGRNTLIDIDVFFITMGVEKKLFPER